MFEASAGGGSITGLMQSALVTGAAQVVLSMGRDLAEPWRAAPALVRHPDDLVETAQSTYQLAPYLGALRREYDAEPAACVAMTGCAP